MVSFLMKSLVELARKAFYLLPEGIKMMIVKTVNNCLLYLCSRR